MMNSIRRGYSNLWQFSGRDTRAQFWPFALLQIIAALAIWLPFFLTDLFASMEEMRAFAEANPDKATIIDEPGRYSITIHDPPPGLGPDFQSLLVPLFIIVPVLVFLLAAAVARRLHDAGRPGWVGAIPAILFFVAGTAMWNVFGDAVGADFDIAGFFAVFFLNLAYNVSLIVLLIFLCMPTKTKSNRYVESEDQPPE